MENMDNKNIDNMERICVVCGESAMHRSYLLVQTLENEVKNRLSWFLTPKINIYFNDRNNICAICLYKVENTIEMIKNMRNTCLQTTVILKAYYENTVESGWHEFKKADIAVKLKSDIETKMFKEIECVPFKIEKNSAVNSQVKIKGENVKVEEDYTDIEWLSDLESEISQNRYPTQLQDNSMCSFMETNKNEENSVEPSEQVQKSKPNTENKNLRINKRGLVYITSAQDHVSKEEDGTYKCVFCTETFKYQYKAELHVRSSHTQERPFECSFCFKKFAASQYLKRHISEVHQERKFICEVCSKTFIRRYEYVAHQKTHTEHPQFSCSYSDCKKQFYSKLSMRRHYYNTHEDKMLVCDECGETFRRKYHLTRHIRSRNHLNMIV